MFKDIIIKIIYYNKYIIMDNKYYTSKLTLDKKYNIIKYNKPVANTNNLYNHIKYYRTQVVEASTNDIVCVGPCKSIPYNTFVTMVNNNDDIVFEEFIDGVMINLFYTDTGWEIATRSTVGGHTRFYFEEEGMTFNEMFYDAVSHNNINLDLLHTEYCYSFVLQHPRHRIVVPVDSPTLYLVEAYKINDNKIRMANIHTELLLSDVLESKLLIPKVFKFDNPDDAVKHYNHYTGDYSTMGVVLKDYKQQLRTKIRTPAYIQVKLLKGNQPNKQYLFVSLYKTNSVNEYLTYFPEDYDLFTVLKNSLHKYTNDVYNSYVQCFILKNKHINEYPPHVKYSLSQLHTHYLERLRPNNLSISHKRVVNWVKIQEDRSVSHFINMSK